MAKKIVAQEDCIFCHPDECSCVGQLRSKVLRDKHKPTRHEKDTPRDIRDLPQEDIEVSNGMV